MTIFYISSCSVSILNRYAESIHDKYRDMHVKDVSSDTEI